MKPIRITCYISQEDHERSKAIAERTGYKLRKVYELAIANGLEEFETKPTKNA